MEEFFSIRIDESSRGISGLIYVVEDFQVGGLGLKVVGEKPGSFGKGSDPLFQGCE